MWRTKWIPCFAFLICGALLYLLNCLSLSPQVLPFQFSPTSHCGWGECKVRQQQCCLAAYWDQPATVSKHSVYSIFFQESATNRELMLPKLTVQQKWHIAWNSARDFVPEDLHLERNNCRLCKNITASWEGKMVIPYKILLSFVHS